MGKESEYLQLTGRIHALKSAYSGLEVRTPANLSYRGKSYPFFALYLSHEGVPFRTGKKNICVSAGIHGDEPGGVEALLKMFESGHFFDPYLKDFDFIIFPCINPAGYELRQRETPDGVDLNRQFGKSTTSFEVNLIKELIHSIPIYLHFDFHEDVDAPGFYLYEVLGKGADPVGEKIIHAVSEKYPINRQEVIEGRKARGGIIRPEPGNASAGVDELLKSTPHWPMTFYFYSQGSSHSFTFETPIHLGIDERAEIHQTALSNALDALAVPN